MAITETRSTFVAALRAAGCKGFKERTGWPARLVAMASRASGERHPWSLPALFDHPRQVTYRDRGGASRLEFWISPYTDPHKYREMLDYFCTLASLTREHYECSPLYGFGAKGVRFLPMPHQLADDELATDPDLRELIPYFGSRGMTEKRMEIFGWSPERIHAALETGLRDGLIETVGFPVRYRVVRRLSWPFRYLRHVTPYPAIPGMDPAVLGEGRAS